MVNAAQAHKFLQEKYGKQQFKLHLGTRIKSLEELAELLDIMSEESFHHHIGKGKNDFASWIRNSVGDVELARFIQKVTSRKEMAERIRKRLEYLQAKTNEQNVETHLIMRRGAVDFALGMVIGILVGLFVALLVV